MSMLFPLLIFILSLALMLKGSDVFVESAESIAKLLGASEFTIGLTLVAIATSLPELATGIMSSLTGHTAIAAGTIIGSNIANMGLVLGISSLIVAINLKKEIYRRDSLFLFGVSVLFFIFSLDGTIQRGEGLLLLCVFLLYVYFLIKYRPALDEKKFEKLLGHFYKPHKIHTLQTYEQALKKGLNYVTYKKLIGLGIDVKTAYREKLMLDIGKHVALGTFGMVVIYFGAKYLISSTLEISSLIHVPEEVLAVSLIAFGTSLPELSVSFVALKKGFGNILMGNIVGSCLANILLVGGISASLAAMDISSFDIVIAIPIMVLMVVFFIRYLQLEWLSRVMQGVTLLFLYGVFILSLALYYFL